MAQTSLVSQTPGPPVETLADMLSIGPLLLPAALRCAMQIAAALCDLHQRGRGHGQVVASQVVMRESGADLQPARNSWDRPGDQSGDQSERDVRAFGVLFYEMLTGRPPAEEFSAADARIAGRASPAKLRAAAVKLAGRCMTMQPGQRLTMQQAIIGIRLLAVLLRQYEPMTGAPRPPDPAPAPFLVIAPSRVLVAGARAVSQPETDQPEQPYGAPAPSAVAPWESIATRRLHTGKKETAPVVGLALESFRYPKPKPPVELHPAGGRCPKCNSAAVYVSRPRSEVELLWARWRIPICRCHRCYHRYVVFAGMKISKRVPMEANRLAKPWRRKV